MLTKKIILGVNSAKYTGAGLITMMAMIPKSMVGPTDAQRKLLAYIDPAIADKLGIKIADVRQMSQGSILLDHQSLQSRIAGGITNDADTLAGFIDATGEYVIDTSISDVETVIFILGADKAHKLSFHPDVRRMDIDDVGIAVHGAFADIVYSIFEPAISEELTSAEIAAFAISFEVPLSDLAVTKNGAADSSRTSAT